MYVSEQNTEISDEKRVFLNRKWLRSVLQKERKASRTYKTVNSRERQAKPLAISPFLDNFAGKHQIHAEIYFVRQWQ